jgi:hypothetical protein
MAMSQEIRPGDAEWDEVASRLSAFMENMEASTVRRLAADEVSFRQFCAVALQSIATVPGYTLKNIEEFVRDMGWALKSGWQRGLERAREKRLRP